MEIAGWAGILASLLGLALTIYGVFYNGRANRALLRSIQADIQMAREQTARQHEDTRALIESFQAQTARQHEDVRTLLEAIQASIQATREQTARQHEDLMAFLREMDRRHTEIMARLGELIVTARD